MRITYPDLMIKMLSGNQMNLYIFFQILAVCTGVYMHATFLVVEIADSSLGQALNGQHFIADKEPPKQFFLSLKETWISFNHNIV